MPGSLPAAAGNGPPDRRTARRTARESERRTRRPAVDSCPDDGRDGGLASNLALEALLEALDLAGGVDDRLLAREERMAVRAHVDAELRSRGPNGPLGAARAAMDLGFVILGMDIGLHGAVLLRTPSVQGCGPAGGRRLDPVCLGARRRGFHRVDPDALLVLGGVLELDLARDRGEDRVVPPETRARAGEEGHAALADDDRAGGHELAVAGLDAEPLAGAVAAVLDAAAGLLVCHLVYSSFLVAVGFFGAVLAGALVAALAVVFGAAFALASAAGFAVVFAVVFAGVAFAGAPALATGFVSAFAGFSAFAVFAVALVFGTAAAVPTASF